MGVVQTVGLGGGAGLPRSPRRRVLIEGTFQTLTGSHSISVKNVSCTGALIECAQALRVGSDGVLEAGELDSFCTIVRSRPPHYGLRFDEPLDNEQVLAMHRVTQEHLNQAEAIATREWYQSRAW